MAQQLLSNSIVTLRALEPEDLEVLYRWENDTRLWTATNTQAPFSRQLLRDYLASYTTDIYASQQLRLMITLTATGEPVGTVDLMNFDALNSHAELGLLIAPGYQQCGYGREALSLVKLYACEHIGLRQLYVIVDCNNAPSLKLMRGAGFIDAGRLKSWIRRGSTYHDAMLLQLVF